MDNDFLVELAALLALFFAVAFMQSYEGRLGPLATEVIDAHR